MGALLYVAATLFLAYLAYRQAKRRGEWRWKQFFLLIGLVALFGVGFILPVVNSKWLWAHPGFFLPVFLAGIAVFIAALLFFFRKRPGPASRKDAA